MARGKDYLVSALKRSALLVRTEEHAPLNTWSSTNYVYTRRSRRPSQLQMAWHISPRLQSEGVTHGPAALRMNPGATEEQSSLTRAVSRGDCQGILLMTICSAHVVMSGIRPVRFERTTCGFEVRRSIQLSYGRISRTKISLACTQVNSVCAGRPQERSIRAFPM